MNGVLDAAAAVAGLSARWEGEEEPEQEPDTDRALVPWEASPWASPEGANEPHPPDESPPHASIPSDPSRGQGEEEEEEPSSLLDGEEEWRPGTAMATPDGTVSSDSGSAQSRREGRGWRPLSRASTVWVV